MMKLRMFGSKECARCLELQRKIEARRLVYIFVDAYDFDDPAEDALCGEHDVNDIPHLQLLDASGEVVAQWIGEINFDDVLRALK